MPEPRLARARALYPVPTKTVEIALTDEQMADLAAKVLEAFKRAYELNTRGIRDRARSIFWRLLDQDEASRDLWRWARENLDQIRRSDERGC